MALIKNRDAHVKKALESQGLLQPSQAGYAEAWKAETDKYMLAFAQLSAGTTTLADIGMDETAVLAGGSDNFDFTKFAEGMAEWNRRKAARSGAK